MGNPTVVFFEGPNDTYKSATRRQLRWALLAYGVFCHGFGVLFYLTPGLDEGAVVYGAFALLMYVTVLVLGRSNRAWEHECSLRSGVPHHSAHPGGLCIMDTSPTIGLGLGR